MLRVTRRSFHKLVIVESPNKVSKIQSLLTGVPDWSFGDSSLKRVGAIPNETVTVIPTIGHFLELRNMALNVKPTPAVFDVVTAASITSSPSDPSVPEESGTSKAKKKKQKKGGPSPSAAPRTPQSALQGTFSEDRPFREILLDWQPSSARNVTQELVQQIQQWKDGSLTEIILATDPDREGELISSHVYYTLLEKLPDIRTPFSRAYIHSITTDGVLKAMQERRVGFLDEGLFRAAEVRHGMDRMFGFLGSSVVRVANPLLRSVGRVQTPALIELQRREEKIASYLAAHRASFSIQADLLIGKEKLRKTVTLKTDKPGSEVAAVPVASSGDDAPLSEEAEQAQIQAYMKALQLDKAHKFVVPAKPTTSTVLTQPPLPLTMATAILAANKHWKMSSEAVAKGLQDLFQAGLVTYPRTDSSRIDSSILPSVYDAVTKKFGASALWKMEDRSSSTESSDDATAKKSSSKSKKSKKQQQADQEANAEHAHEAIRPTSWANEPSVVSAQLQTTDAKLLYQLIYNTTLAAFMKPQAMEKITVTLQFQSGSGATLSTKLEARREVDPGFRRAFADDQKTLPDESAAEELQDESDSSLFNEVEKLSAALMGSPRRGSAAPSLVLDRTSVNKSKPNPPPQHSEGSLIEELRRNGVGRPSTYPSILKTLLARGYIIVNSKGKCEVTETGKKLVEVATRAFPSVVDMAFTAKFEQSLDAIAVSPHSDASEFANAVASSFLSDLIEMIAEAVSQRKLEIIGRMIALRLRKANPEWSDKELQARATAEAAAQFGPQKQQLLHQLRSNVNKSKDFDEVQKHVSIFTKGNFPAY
jgi:DNA topoisomerase IA